MNLKIIQFNCRSYHTNRHLIHNLLAQEDPDILLLNSTGLPPSPIRYFGYTTRYTTETHFDGIAILAKTTLTPQFLLGNWNNRHFMAVKILTTHGPIIFATTYTRPNTNIPYADLNSLFNNNIPTYILADFNARHTIFNHTTNNTHGRELEQLYRLKNLRFLGPDFDTFYAPTQGETRRGRPDLVLANRLTLPFHHHLSPGPLTGSDHLPVILRISTNPIYVATPPRPNFNKTDWTAFTDALTDVNFNNNYDGLPADTLDDRAEEIESTLYDTAIRFTPLTNYTRHVDFTPSIRTQRLLICYRHRFSSNQHRIHEVHWDLNILRRHILNSLQEDHNRHWNNIIQNIEPHRINNPSKFWSHIHKLKGNTTEHFDYLNINNNRITEPQEVLEAFKQHWENVFQPHPPTPIPTVQEHITHINNYLEQEQENIRHDSHIHLHNLNPREELIRPFDHDEVKYALQKARRRAPGPSGLTHHALRALPPNAIEALKCLYNAALACGYFPRPYKTANIRLIPKPGKTTTDPSNYRPISLLNLLGKIFEKLLNRRLRLHLDTHDLIPSHQYAFRPLTSTEDALNAIITYIHASFNSRKKTVLVTKDIQKAFDTVWHDGLKYKIAQNFRLPLPFTKLLCNYLTDRRCRVKHRTETSDFFTPLAGVPQGSVLAPTLYNMYTHDIRSPLDDNTLLIQYADDITLLTRATTLDALTNRMQAELNQMTSWERLWRITSNPAKSSAIYFGRKTYRPTPLFPFATPDQRGALAIPTVNKVKVLGVNIDKNLTFNGHIREKEGQARRALSSLQRFRPANVKTKRHLYLAIIFPLITYCPLALSHSAPTNKLKLQRIQNKALRFINNTKWDDFYTSESLHNISKRPPLTIVWHNKKIKQIEKYTLIRPQTTEHLTRLAQTRFNPNGTTLLDPDAHPLPNEPIYK